MFKKQILGLLGASTQLKLGGIQTFDLEMNKTFFSLTLSAISSFVIS